MTILHGDDRVYNNILMQHYPITRPEQTPEAHEYEVVGTAPFDIFPSYEEWVSHFGLNDQKPNMGELATWHFKHLPAWVGGNAYLNGATVSRHEKTGFRAEGEKAEISLEEREDGRWVLKTNAYEIIKDFRAGIITSDLLGKAFEPEQRFENPDGTAITFNRDYAGKHRGTETLPGPFAEGGNDWIVW